MPALETGKFASHYFFQLHKDTIHKVLENPDLLMELSPEDLERISKQYPYFSAAQVLLSKSYQRRKDHRFADQVAQASLYSGNREKLYHYLKEEATVIETPIISLPRAEQTAPVATPMVEQPPVISIPVAEIPIPPPSQEKEVAKNDFAGLVDFILDEKGITPTSPASIEDQVVAERREITFHVDEVPEITPQPVYEKEASTASELTGNPPKTSIPEMDDLQREILLEAIQSSIEQEVGETEKDIASPVSSRSTPEEPLAGDTSFAAWVYRRSQQVHFAENPEEQPIDETNSPDISDWKHLSEAETNTAQQEKTGEDKDVDELLNKEETSTLSHSSKRIQSTDYETHKRDLIDRFIRQDPRIARGKTTDYTPGNIAKDSVEEDHLPVTETMAQLYARQGRLDKARKAFKKLIELHPEKSVYFAAQLKNLDKFKKP
ncbi:MAG: tetratricopeptide repeat protein [Flavobacteriales bacterium]